MKLLLILLLWARPAGQQQSKIADDMEHIRISYEEAPVNKTTCRAMIEKLASKTQSAVHLAYLGAFKAIWAKHTLNPLGKLSTFKKGKTLIEQAVRNDPDNVEIRFLRLSVQKNCPDFLGYNKQIEGDRQFIDANKARISSAQLKKMLAQIRE